ncbi:MAG TPA: hypothetical protein VK327_02645, partial [Candidatus Paceibacterota bacterium]|nr:hypothetical protein [Candidatus Paceibacterota bacterium]
KEYMRTHRGKLSDEELVERARRVIATKGKLRWAMLVYGIGFLGVCGYFTLAGIRKIENLEANAEQVGVGFVYGVAIAIAWVIFGILGGLCLGKFLIGFQNDFRLQELLVSYHDLLRDKGRLPKSRSGQ